MSEKNKKFKIGITQGDINGISYEVIIKSLMDNRIMDVCTPIVYGSSKIASYHKKLFNAHDFNFNMIRNPGQATMRRPNMINIVEDEVKIDLGTATENSAQMALLSIEEAVKDLKDGKIDAVVTAPINKSNIYSDKFSFPGHTEYFARAFNSDDYLMFMICEALKIGVVTGHIPFNEVSDTITKELVLHKINLMHKSLVEDFKLVRPKIAVLGLNPHAGDEGLFGKEEINVISHAIREAYSSKINAFGTYPADGFFASGAYRKFDAVLAMYHDQGLVPFKILSYDEGVNFTSGLPIVRTSPAHGTAYDIAGKGIASPDSFRQAIYAAVDICTNRNDD